GRHDAAKQLHLSLLRRGDEASIVVNEECESRLRNCEVLERGRQLLQADVDHHDPLEELGLADWHYCRADPLSADHAWMDTRPLNRKRGRKRACLVPEFSLSGPARLQLAQI